MTYSTLGWLSVVIAVILITPYVLKYINKLNKNLINVKSKSYKKTMKFFRLIHKPLGISLLVIALIHGYMALGGFRLHTGSLLYLSIVLTAVFGGSFYKTKKKVFFTWHRRMAIVSVLLFVLHFVAPGAVYSLLNM